MVQSNSVTITVTAPAPTYTCYIGHCKTFRLPNGTTYTTCVADPYSSSTPCPAGQGSPSEACSGVEC